MRCSMLEPLESLTNEPGPVGSFLLVLTQEHRTRLLKELSARLVRDKQLRYAERELQMQRLLMAKGASRKLSGGEKVEDDIMIGQEETGAVRKQESSCILYATMKRKRTVCLSWNPLKLNSNILVRDRTQCTHI